jgi:hypothetical protein
VRYAWPVAPDAYHTSKVVGVSAARCAQGRAEVRPIAQSGIGHQVRRTSYRDSSATIVARIIIDQRGLFEGAVVDTIFRVAKRHVADL